MKKVVNGELVEDKTYGEIGYFWNHHKDKINSIFAAAGTDGANACVQLKQLINEAKGIFLND